LLLDQEIIELLSTLDGSNKPSRSCALELARLDELQETFYARALEGDVACSP
jgi:hypothetical protein